ncbi:hypothetical protein [Janibacter hoylei]|uniref:hypothetical protein n=1 Tax=Janibacter hoylei TaxID=364298 RepID=UPI0002F532A0
MTDEQVRDVKDLTRKAGIKPTTTRVSVGHELLGELAPGERSFPGAFVPDVPQQGNGGAKGGSPRRRSRPVRWWPGWSWPGWLRPGWPASAR